MADSIDNNKEKNSKKKKRVKSQKVTASGATAGSEKTIAVSEEAQISPPDVTDVTDVTTSEESTTSAGADSSSAVEESTPQAALSSETTEKLVEPSSEKTTIQEEDEPASEEAQSEETLTSTDAIKTEPQTDKDELNNLSESETSFESATMPEIDDDNIFDSEIDGALLDQVAGVYQIWWNWAHFEITIVSPSIESISLPVIIQPEAVASTDEKEFVYPIVDYGNTLLTSKGTEMYSIGMSMCKLFYTIEKMIFILIERLKQGGIDTKTEVQVIFDGHQIAQRKAFESIINLSYNVVVTNFDPGVWGERYLEIVKRLADKGYGYPTESPRDIYRIKKKSSPTVRR